MLPPVNKDGAAVVTGASFGIGEQIAREFARRGYPLVLIARRADRLQTLAASLDGVAHVLPADLSQPADRAALPDQVAALGIARTSWSTTPASPRWARSPNRTPRPNSG
jgi:uncharacterized protein